MLRKNGSRKRAGAFAAALFLSITGATGFDAAAIADVGAAAVAQVSPTPAQTIQNIGASGAWWVNDLARFSPAVQQLAAAPACRPVTGRRSR